MGVPIFDNLDLEAVAREAATRKRWDFLVTASPAAVPGATGSVLNPDCNVLMTSDPQPVSPTDAMRQVCVARED